MENTVFRRLLLNTALCFTSSLMFTACGGNDAQGPVTNDAKLLADGEACNPAWVSTTAYVGGNAVSYSGRNYTAAYWTQNNNPSTSSGPAGSGQPWIPGYLCGGTTTTTKATTTTTKAATTTTATGTTTTKATTTTTKAGSSCPAYVAGTTYAVGASVTNAGGAYTCDVSGWCSGGASAYEPGVGWAWTSAWHVAAAGACTGTTTTTKATTTTTKAGGTTTAPTTTTTKATTTTTQNCSAGCTWNKLTTFTMVNGTRGAYADSQVYWSIIGKDWNTGKFVHVDMNGNLIPMAMSDNGALTKNGVGYTNYFYTLAQKKSVTIPPINSARMMLSVGSPMYIQVNTDVNGNIGYAGANIENPADPNLNVYFDFIEMAIVPTSGFYGNTTRVDQFGFPVTMRLQGLGGYDQTVGETETRAALISAYIANVPNEFKGLAQAPYAPYRIIAPAHATFNSGGANANYLDSYINAIWSKYTTQTLTFTDQQGTFSGKVVGGKFQFTDGQGTYYINSKPTTAMALLGSGSLADGTGAAPGVPTDKQLQIQAQLCAAINRHVVDDPAHWSDSNYYYPAGQPANYFAKFFHDHSINKLSYGFAYDDVWNYSSSLHTGAPTTATVTIGW